MFPGECTLCLPFLVIDWSMYEASVVSVSELGICLSCTFFTDSTAEGCAVRLENDEHSFLFNTSRHNDEDLVLLECFPVQEEGVFSVTVYEIRGGEIQEHISQHHKSVEIIRGMRT